MDIPEKSPRPGPAPPTLVEGSLAVCERCGMLVRFIESYERGDATLGYVNHNYVVTKE